MQLPLVEEIREARRRSQEAHDAHMHLGRVDNTLQMIGFVEAQLSAQPAFEEVPLPGDDLVEQLAERWPALTDLAAGGPRPGQTVTTRLQLRRGQLEAAQQQLRPLAQEAPRRAQQLSGLQHEQRHLLEDPRWGEAVAELTGWNAEREATMQRLQPLNVQLSALRPAAQVVASFRERLAEHAYIVEDGADAQQAWLAAVITRSLVESLNQAFATLEVGVTLPPSPEVPSEPAQADIARLREQVSVAADALDRVGSTLDERTAVIGADAAALQERYEQLTRQIVDRMG